uniref:Uncharacterized protein n=1 Tax=Lotharella oceanica TaxID=641309 RepID=A0A7S2TFC2_9EUKA|mmetsp:Transcript_11413/g.21905  ORF Transcript_11413/g.21905 Transcript_11413/m.21905 type:complete len:112 (+) Transcript_11413:452-787(+)
MLVMISIIYTLKAFYWWGAVLRELHHPFRIHYFFGPLLGIINLCNGAPYEVLDRVSTCLRDPPCRWLSSSCQLPSSLKYSSIANGSSVTGCQFATITRDTSFLSCQTSQVL